MCTNTMTQPAVLARGIVMTTSTNDTPLSEPPGADNMPTNGEICAVSPSYLLYGVMLSYQMIKG